VITTAFSYGPNDLWPFLHSLSEHAPQAKILVLTSPSDLRKLQTLQQHFPQLSLRTISFSPKIIKGRIAPARKVAARIKRWTRRRQQNLLQNPDIAIEQPSRFGLSTLHSHFLIRRFFWAREQLSQPLWSGHNYVMLCDARDVVVQADPFENVGNAFITGEEFGLFDHCSMNRRWVRRAYGAETEKALCGAPALCAGVMIGSREQMLLYLDLFCNDALAMMRRHSTSCLENLDQAIHNKILRGSSGLKMATSPVNGHIATVGCVPGSEIYIPKGPGKIEVMGAVPRVIHQYDRRSALVEHVERQHSRPAATNSAKKP
jgi:hypothetical protein